MSALVRYEAARTALAEAHRVDEVKDIRDKAEAMAAYARQAKDQELILYATEIKVRAERRAGEMILLEREAGRMVSAGGDRRSETKVEQTTLKDYGVSSDQGVRWTALAQMPSEHFETAVATAKETAGQVTTAFMLREAQRAKPQAQPMKGKKADALRQELAEAKERGVSILVTYARMTLKTLCALDSVTDQERAVLGELADAIAAMTA